MNNEKGNMIVETAILFAIAIVIIIAGSFVFPNDYKQTPDHVVIIVTDDPSKVVIEDCQYTDWEQE